MPIFELQTPDGRSFEIEAPDMDTAVQALDSAPQSPQMSQAAMQPGGGADALPEMAWSDVASGALKSAPESAYNFGKAMVQPFIHPVETLQNVGDLAAGGLRLGMRKALPESVSNYIESTDTDPTAAGRQVGMAQGVGQFYKDRYGSMGGIKNALATDPVGVAGDAATVLTGGGAAMTKIGPLSKAGSVASTAGAEMNPLTQVSRLARGTGKLGKNVLGMTTGTSADAIGEAYKAGRAGGQQGTAFRQNIRGKEDPEVVITEARDAMNRIHEDQGAQYQKDMRSIQADKTPIDIAPIIQTFNDTVDSVYYRGHLKASKETKAKLEEIYKVLEEWEADPSVHNAGGLDALKQRIGQLAPSALEAGNAGRVVTAMYNAVRDAIVKQAPQYAKAMENYEKSQIVLDELKKSLSLGKNVSADTTLRKLQSVTRNNANTNYGSRAKSADLLEKAGAKTMKAKLAGQALNTWMPRGLRGPIAATALTGLGTYFSPLALPGLLAGSPRLAGEATHLAGRASRRASQLPLPTRGGLLGARALGSVGLLGEELQ